MRTLALSILCLAVKATSQPNTVPLDSVFPATQYQLVSHSTRFGSLDLAFSKALPKAVKYPLPSFAVEIRNRSHVIKRLLYHDVESLGGFGDLAIPASQPSDECFLLVKRGDYNGRTLVVFKDGHVYDLPGGQFLLTPDKSHLLSFHELDGCSGLVVFNIHSRKVTYSSEDHGLFVDYPRCYWSESRVIVHANPDAIEGSRPVLISVDPISEIIAVDTLAISPSQKWKANPLSTVKLDPIRFQ